MNAIATLASLNLDGELRTDIETGQQASTDLGMILKEMPVAVLQPRSASDIAAVLKAARDLALPVTARGLGSSTYGQAVPLPGGIVIDMAGFNQIHSVGHDQCVVDAGAKWTQVVEATLAHDLTPPTLTDYIDLTVGGTLSWGGMGPMSFRHGLQVDNVLAIEVVTTDGEIHQCSPTAEADLFYAVLGGMGLIGIITRATLRLIPAPKMVRLLRIPYPDAQTLEADLKLLVEEKRIGTAQGIIVAPEDKWLYLMEATIFHDGDAIDEGAVLEHLQGFLPALSRHDMSYAQFVTRLGTLATLPCGTAQKPHAHPWWATMTSQALASEIITDLTKTLDPKTAGPFDLIITYPVPTAVSKTPLPSLPAAEWLFVVANFSCVDASDKDRIDSLLAMNRQLYEKAAEDAPQGAVDPVSAVDYSQDEWQRHLAGAWPVFKSAKQKYDPQGILARARVVF